MEEQYAPRNLELPQVGMAQSNGPLSTRGDQNTNRDLISEKDTAPVHMADSPMTYNQRLHHMSTEENM